MSGMGPAAGEVTDASGDHEIPIVSVNEVQSRKIGWGWYIGAAVGVLALTVGVFLALSSIQWREMLLPSSPKVETKTPIDSAVPSTAPITLTAAVPVPSGVSGTGTVARVGLGDQPPCAPRMMTDDAGRPVRGSDGQWVLIGCDGRPVPRTEGNARTPTVSLGNAGMPASSGVGTGGGAAGSAGISLPLLADRYGGPVLQSPSLVQAKGSATQALAPPEEALALLRRFEERSTAPAGFNGAGSALPLATSGTPTTARTAPLAAAEAGKSTARATATALQDRRYLVLRGAHIECALTLRYVSDYAGEAHCVTTRDVFGHDGTAIVVPRGSTANGAFGVARGIGERRGFVQWERVVTPSGVTVSIASKATDALGATGIDATVDQRWWDRLGVAASVSVVKDVMTAMAARYAASAAQSQVVTSAQNFTDQILAQTIAIQPTLYTAQGSIASIVLQQDIDFAGVYAANRK